MNKFKYIGISCLLLSLTGCSDSFLDADNKSTGNENGLDYIASHPEALRATAYSAVTALATEMNMHDMGTDMYINPSSNDGDFGTYALTPENSTVSSFYTNAYKLINYANGILRFASEDDIAYRQEGRFLRALGYFYLVQQYGGVPYIEEYIANSNRDYPRLSTSELYGKLIEDLEDVYNNCALEATAAATNYDGHVSRQAVAALLAKVCLTAGWDVDTELVDAVKGTYNVKRNDYFVKAAQYAEAAINNVPLNITFEQKWSPFNESNQEVIFSLQFERNGYPGDETTGGHSLQNYYGPMYGNCVGTGQKGTPSGGTFQFSVKALRLFEPTDNRYNASFMTTFFNATKNGDVAAWGTEGYYAYYNVSDNDKSKLPIAMRFYPYYVTEAEARADLASIKDRLKSDASDGGAKSYGMNSPQAAIMDDEQIFRFRFLPDGSIDENNSGYVSREEFFKVQYCGPCTKKFDDPNSAQTARDNCYRDIPVFHVSDMYLVAAEAYLLAGNEPAALSKVNDVRNRAGLARLTSFSQYDALAEYTRDISFGALTALDLILDERARELYAERCRWDDLRRTKQLVRYCIAYNRNVNSVADMTGADGEIKWLRPIPAAEFNSNTALSVDVDQNPGY